MSTITHNPAASRYELSVDGAIAIAEYRREGDRLAITHVEVPEALRGKGAGSQLMAGVMAEAKAQGLHIIPVCSFAETYLKRNPIP